MRDKNKNLHTGTSGLSGADHGSAILLFPNFQKKLISTRFMWQVEMVAHPLKHKEGPPKNLFHNFFKFCLCLLHFGIISKLIGLHHDRS